MCGPKECDEYLKGRSERMDWDATGVRNLVRSGALALGATFLGCGLFFTFPDWLAEQLGRVLPLWWYEKEVREVECGVEHVHLTFARGALS